MEANSSEKAKTGRRGVTRDDVWRASDALLVEGQRPTVEKVRMRLGGGSPNTVGPHLDSWFQGLGRRIANPGAFAEPGVKSHPEPIAQAADFLWKAAQHEARRALEDEYAKRFGELEQQRAELERERQQLESARLTLKQHVEAVEQKLDAVSVARDQANAEVARHEERQLALTGELQRANAELARQRADSDHQRTLVADAERRARDERLAWDKERETLSAGAEEVRRRHMLELDAARTSLKQAQEQADAQLKEAAKVRQRLQDELADRRGEAGALEVRLAESTAEQANLRKLLEQAIRPEPARRHATLRPARQPAAGRGVGKMLR